MGTGVHLDVSLNVGHDDPPQLGYEVTLLLLVLVPLFVLHLPGGAEHDPQTDQLLTWIKKKRNIKAIQLNHSFWTPLFRKGDTISGSRNVRYRVRLPWRGFWTVDVISAELGVIQRKFIFNIGWLRMNLNELIYHLWTIKLYLTISSTTGSSARLGLYQCWTGSTSAGSRSCYPAAACLLTITFATRVARSPPRPRTDNTIHRAASENLEKKSNKIRNKKLGKSAENSKKK